MIVQFQSTFQIAPHIPYSVAQCSLNWHHSLFERSWLQTFSISPCSLNTLMNYLDEGEMEPECKCGRWWFYTEIILSLCSNMQNCNLLKLQQMGVRGNSGCSSSNTENNATWTTFNIFSYGKRFGVSYKTIPFYVLFIKFFCYTFFDML